MRFVKKVNERGVLTLPSEVREALGVMEGDIVEFEVLNVIKKRRDDSTESMETESVSHRDEETNFVEAEE
jgi:AbrB family looped-hinge helix DNA binding protein